MGFLRHRLVQKLPEAVPPPTVEARPAPRVAELVVCEGPGDDHVFRPVGDETHCGPCRGEGARAYWAAAYAEQPAHTPWRDRVAALAASPTETT
ncbi:hypothetical protein [Streptomyces sp. NBC_01320]|uniref:hypothetical protein n=1 Tax=Streptomyces sp. NBC_01320 TaxID=2903824 RepID=UPI003FA3AB80